MKISNIKVDEKDDDITLYTASINIDGIICIQNLKINLYDEEMLVEWPKNVSPVNDDVKEYIDNTILSYVVNKVPLHERFCNWMKAGFDY